MSMIGRKVGHYRVLEEIGRGGMGEVWVAFDETLERKVALKTVRRERRLDEEARGRFLREARILSQLRHPGICQVHDFVDDGGTDYLVLELIEGEPLGKAMARRRLEPAERLAIAASLLDVLVAAHDRGIVHRDLKPDNVMLTPQRAVKVLDFGLARLVDEVEASPTLELDRSALDPVLREFRETDETIRTDGGTGKDYKTMHGTVVGTLDYMSPEQARGEPGTAASDVYSLGLILQELFTGERAYEPSSDAAARLERAARGETRPLVGIDADLAALIGRMKSISPSKRPTAFDAAERLAFVRDRPRRRRRAALAAAAVLVLAGFAVVASLQAVRIAREADRANREAVTAARVSDFLVDIFKESDPYHARGNSVTARELLDRGAARIAAGLDAQPAVEVRMLATMGRAYANLGLYDAAAPLLERALRLREAQPLPPDAELGEILRELAGVRGELGAYPEAKALYQRALDVDSALGPDGEEAVAEDLVHFSEILVVQGEVDRGEEMARRAVALRERHPGAAGEELAAALSNLGRILRSRRKLDDAEPLFRRAVSLAEAGLGPEHPDLAAILGNYGNVLFQQGKLEEARGAYERSVAIREKVFGATHPAVAASLMNLASLHEKMGRADLAEAELRRVLAIWEGAFGPKHGYVAKGLTNLGNLLAGEKRWAEAEPVYARALATMEEFYGASHPNVAEVLAGYALVMRETGRESQARLLEERGRAIRDGGREKK